MTTPRKPRGKRPAAPSSTGAMRLQQFLARAGLGSRRKCEEYIVAGRIEIDGKAVELGTRVDPAVQSVSLDGETIRLESSCYFLLNKPTGYVCTHRDPAGRPRAIDLVPQDGPRLFTVGRLDENSRGLLLVTNDGETANRLAHPRYGVHRTYELQVAGRPTNETMEALKTGLHFSDGRFCIRSYRRRRVQKNSSFIEVTLTEGRNREIRRLFSRVGHKVLKLKRIAFGPLRLGNLKEGRYRPLKPDELQRLLEFIETGGPPTAKPKRTKRKFVKHKRAGSRETRRTESKNRKRP